VIPVWDEQTRPTSGPQNTKGIILRNRRSVNTELLQIQVRVVSAVVAVSAFLFDQGSDGIHEIELGEDFEFAARHLDENGGAFVAEDVGNALDGRV
jgi:hypothetical protein